MSIVRLVLLLIPILFFASCKKDADSETTFVPTLSPGCSNIDFQHRVVEQTVLLDGITSSVSTYTYVADSISNVRVLAFGNFSTTDSIITTYNDEDGERVGIANTYSNGQASTSRYSFSAVNGLRTSRVRESFTNGEYIVRNEESNQYSGDCFSNSTIVVYFPDGEENYTRDFELFFYSNGRDSLITTQQFASNGISSTVYFIREASGTVVNYRGFVKVNGSEDFVEASKFRLTFNGDKLSTKEEIYLDDAGNESLAYLTSYIYNADGLVESEVYTSTAGSVRTTFYQYESGSGDYRVLYGSPDHDFYDEPIIP